MLGRYLFSMPDAVAKGELWPPAQFRGRQLITILNPGFRSTGPQTPRIIMDPRLRKNSNDAASVGPRRGGASSGYCFEDQRLSSGGHSPYKIALSLLGRKIHNGLRVRGVYDHFAICIHNFDPLAAPGIAGAP